MHLLETLEINQVVVFVRSSARAHALSKYLMERGFTNLCITGGMDTATRLKNFKAFKERKAVILISTQLLGRGVDMERVNVVINHDFPEKADEYLHRVGRAGRFGTKGLAISYVSNEEETKVMEEVQMKFACDVPELPETIDAALYHA